MSAEFQRGALQFGGKTKQGYSVLQDGKSVPDLIWFEGTDALTKFDNPDLTQQAIGKAVQCTLINDRVMKVLIAAGIPVAYVQQVSQTAFVAERVEMIPLEVVGRRYFVGSSLKRNPELARPEGEPPYRVDEVAVEFYLKTSGGKVSGLNGTIDLGLDPRRGEEDPIVYEPNSRNWQLYHSKKPKGLDAYLVAISSFEIIADPGLIREMEAILRGLFLVLEKAWEALGIHFIDIKVEFGLTLDRQLVVADVIDNDSWRLRTWEKWVELSKEAFRQNEAMEIVAERYGIVAALAEQFQYVG